jgi:hypothetical protein
MGDKKEKKKSHTEPVGRGNGKIKTNWKGTRGQEHPKQKWTRFFGLERGTWTGASDTKHTRFSYLKARPSKGYVRIRLDESFLWPKFFLFKCYYWQICSCVATGFIARALKPSVARRLFQRSRHVLEFTLESDLYCVWSHATLTCVV